MKRNYVRVRTVDLVKDMTRYMGYLEVPETSEPIVAGTRAEAAYRHLWPSWTRVTVHRFSEDGWTYFRQPSVLNRHWLETAIDRYASFGKRAELVRR